jgi:hypothetical protein
MKMAIYTLNWALSATDGSPGRLSRMGKRTKLLLKSLAVTLGTLGVGLWMRRRRAHRLPQNVWARPGMKVTFRAELMPGRDAAQRTFRVKKILPNGRIILDGVSGEHVEAEFETAH